MTKKSPSTMVITTLISPLRPNTKTLLRLTTEIRALMMVFLQMMPPSLQRARPPAPYLRYRPCRTSTRPRRLRPPRLLLHASQQTCPGQRHLQSRHRPCLRAEMMNTIPIGTTPLLRVCQRRSSMISTPCLLARSVRRTICMEPASLGHLQPTAPLHLHRHRHQQIEALRPHHHRPREQLRFRHPRLSALHRCLRHLPPSRRAHPRKGLLIFEDQ